MKPVPAKRDAFGHQMWAFHEGGGSPIEIVERDDGFIGSARSNASYFAGIRHWSRPERLAIRLARGRTALDVGCGPGRVALHLQARGFRVTAIDNSPLAVRTARARGVKDGRLLPFEHVGRFAAGSFDTIVMFGNNFGLFGTHARARRLLKALHKIAKTGAVLLAQARDPHQTNQRVHLDYQRRNRQRGRMPGQIRIRVRFNQWVGPWFDYLLASAPEMAAILDGTGWAVDRFITGEDPSYVAVIRRI